MPSINDYYEDFDKLQNEFHEVMHEYPLFKEMIDKIYDIDIKEINELLDKDDEFYLKKAISKLKDIITYIKDTSLKITKIYNEYDQYVSKWNNLTFNNIPNNVLDKLNDQINKTNTLINSHDIKDLQESIKIMDDIFKDIKYYNK